MKPVFAWTFPGGKKAKQTVAATAGNVVTNLSPGSGKTWILLHGIITLVNDATVADRQIKLQLTDGTNVLQELGLNSTAFTASQTKIIQWNPSTMSTHADAYYTTASCEIPLIIAVGADQLRITVDAGVAGDSYSGYFVVLEIDTP